MLESQDECGLYCPGSLTKPEFRPPEGFDVPPYVAGNLKVNPSLPRDLPVPSPRSPRQQLEMRPVQLPNCFDNFAIAKKFHTENLQHQPLPDRVDDRIFSNVHFGRAKSCGSLRSTMSGRKNHCLTPKIFERSSRNQNGSRYGPELGCKKPETKMDLAICWDAPIDPNYEPRRPVHIDGSDGGPAPAIFTLVQHPTESGRSREYLPACPRPRVASADPEAVDYNDIRRRFEEHCRTDRPAGTRPYVDSPIRDDPVSRNSLRLTTRYKTEDQERCDEIEARRKFDDLNKGLCNGFENMHVSEVERALARRHDASPQLSARPNEPATYFRTCRACDERTKTEHRDRRNHQPRFSFWPRPRRVEDRPHRNGLPTSLHIPRPKTPFARRSFCIDTLAPPFSVVKGCRDADYPEHWRLTSIYQQSYKPPTRNFRPSMLSRTKR